MPRTPPFGLKRALDVQRRLVEALRCTTCKKLTTVANIAARGFKPESISEKTHCTCPGRIVELRRAGAFSPLSTE